MSNQSKFPEEEKFSDDPEENLQMQNDFLKMKMMVESGAFFGGEGNIPADIENQFLKNILEIEKSNADAKPAKIFDILGCPVFEEEQYLNEEQFIIEFKRLQELLSNFSINVDFSRERDDRFKYNFITKEFLDHESIFKPVKGMSTYFLYEEFHPDHELDILDQTENFLNDFLERKINNDSYILSNEIIEPDGKIVSREEMIKRFQSMYEVVPEFENTSFSIENQDFELNKCESGISGMAFTEGLIQYDLIFKNGERKQINGPFKIYFSRQSDYWDIYFFYLAGFNLLPQKKVE
ncbi:MAG TPA: hypothetical protein VN722_12040 [Hanamia sp.]|jgi:hypothetical protein|nr:hypothetical protein [Hanamia sp.]